jgi:hypothetical protein
VFIWSSKYLPKIFPVPIYDGRTVDFDIKNFQWLPKYDNEVDEGALVMAMFTAGKYSSVAGDERLSLNIQAVVAMHDPVPESEWPPETIVEGKEPFPIL